MKAQNVTSLSENTIRTAKLKDAIFETRSELGYRRPHVRAAMDLAAVIADDPNLSDDPANAYKVVWLASHILAKAERKLPSGLAQFAKLATNASAFNNMAFSENGGKYAVSGRYPS